MSRTARLDVCGTMIACVVDMIETTWRDFRLAARSLLRARAVAAAVVATLAIGIGATTLIFSIVNGVLLKPLPYPDADRLVVLNYAAPGFDNAELPSAPFLNFVIEDQSETFAATGLWDTRAAAVTGLAEPERLVTVNLTANVLPLLEVPPALGRLFAASDDEPGAPRTTVLTHGYWQRAFGADPTVVGRTMTIDGSAHEIIGVMPPGFRFLDEDPDLFLPEQFDRDQTRLGLFGFNGIGRLANGVSIDTASAEIARLIPIAIDTFPPFPGSSREQFRAAGFAPLLRPLKTEIVGDVGATLWVLMGTIGIVLLIACANVANLFLIRTEGRSRELAVRAALGAGRAAIAHVVLIEGLLLGVAGGVAGLALAYGGLELVLNRGPANLPRLEEIAIDANVLAFAAVIAPLTGLLFGILPALRFTSPHFGAALGTAGRASTGRDQQRVHSTLVVVQVSLALVLTIASGLMLRSVQALGNVDPGFTDAAAVQTVRINVPDQEIADNERTLRVMQAVVERIAAIPGVEAAAFGSSVPMDGSRTLNPIYAEGADYGESAFSPTRRLKFVSPGFFASLGAPLVAGRDLSWTDHYDRRPVTIVSESLARDEWGSAEAALGERIRLNPDDPWREVVGVAGDVREDGLTEPSPATAYFPVLLENFWSAPDFLWRPVALVVRTPRAGTGAFIRDLERAVWSVNGNLPIADARTLLDLYERSYARTSFTLVLLGVAGAMALTLSLVGIYGVIAYAISRRSREIGIRLALGATAHAVQSLFWRQALGLIGAGIAIGLVAALGLTRVLESLLFGVTALDLSTFLIVPLALVAITAIACYLPARRALRIDPIEALRDE